MDSRPQPSLTNKHLRTMAWAAFGVAVLLAAFNLASDTVVVGFLSKAAADLIAPTVRNMAEDRNAMNVEVSKNESNSEPSIKISEV